ncbi:hypothetical protein [Natrinema versiforme]|uniref:Uncharacterized protein n=1 Tax=Natrinema versiforme JCM 10478 TaxID=1227496 RepID=L9XX03_9EURY|nr:hypothetical protein [Natrinema versiforme]ELY66305.1 hypothetical protein C489_13126 [Natrinema versiforme JCM 10478]
MADNTVEVRIESVTATHDRSGAIEHVDIELTHDGSVMNDTRHRAPIPAVEYRFVVDDRTAKLVEINTVDEDSEHNYDGVPGVSLDDLQTISAAYEVLEGFDAIDDVESVDETVAEVAGFADEISYKD